MYPTCEIRWFFREDLPPEVSGWFLEHEGAPEVQEAREDQYLLLPGQDAPGIKLREGRIEVKHRFKSHGIMMIMGKAEGYAGDWRKWSFILGEENPPLAHLINPANSWINVWKKRTLFRYVKQGSGSIRSVSTGDLCTAGCDVELSELFFDGEQWWSLCLEAFGPEEQNRHTLETIFHFFFDQALPRSFSKADSYGYPLLLQQFVGD